ncbi:unnamed protein product [Didymodactylos carnosus]|uniref:Uncharacterized protein n=1 Tax=Didymodactylos carnosus TaxID=1234261 RepID=A0A814FAG8_9BILA|nr:unnamed protein product [Didymodactylos carnosus]CAF0977279.1 unnamed protein product [Didymodactylos carnosus]CAF3651240.1 unnamed protein product [Didymodactylos carnosus]CAF3750114.1 unnamed protein product [Didymodactylos carnosus]
MSDESVIRTRPSVFDAQLQLAKLKPIGENHRISEHRSSRPSLTFDIHPHSSDLNTPTAPENVFSSTVREAAFRFLHLTSISNSATSSTPSRRNLYRHITARINTGLHHDSLIVDRRRLPTYQLKPTYKINYDELKLELENSELKQQVERMHYNQANIQAQTTTLINSVRTKVKSFLTANDEERYKVIVQAIIYQNSSKSMTCASRCLWNKETDNSITLKMYGVDCERIHSHIASAIIPTGSIVSVPAVDKLFPQQKSKGKEEWGLFASILLRASLTSSLLTSQDLERKGLSVGHHIKGSKEQSNVEAHVHKQLRRALDPEPLYASVVKSTTTRSDSLSNAERRATGCIINDGIKYTSATNIRSIQLSGDINNAVTTLAKITPVLRPNQALTEELSLVDENGLTLSTVVVAQQPAFNLTSGVPLNELTTSHKVSSSTVEFEQLLETRSSTKSSLDIQGSGKFLTVTFKEPVHDTIEVEKRSLSKKSPQSSLFYTPLTEFFVPDDSMLDRIVIPPPQEYQPDIDELGRKYNDQMEQNTLLNEQVHTLQQSNDEQRRCYDDLFNLLQDSQKAPQQHLTNLLPQFGREQIRDLDDLNKTLQSRCIQLEKELYEIREKNSDQNQVDIYELKNENYYLRDYVHRLNAALSDYQTQHLPISYKKELEKERKKLMQIGLPMKGPTPSWLLNQKFLAPLFLCYDEKLYEKDEFIKKLQTQLYDLSNQVKVISQENLVMHEKLSKSTINDETHLSDVDHIKQQAYLVLEENKILQEQLDLQTNHLRDVQKSQIQEVSKLTKHLLLVESERTETDKNIEYVRLKNQYLTRRYEQLMFDSDHHINVEEHIKEISEMKRLTDELSEKHALEMHLLLKRVQDAETSKKVRTYKLTDSKSENERLKGEIRTLEKVNKKFQLRIQNFEKKLEIQQIKEQKALVLLAKVTDEVDQIRLERDTYHSMVKMIEEDMNTNQTRILDESVKLVLLDENLETCKGKPTEKVTEVQEQMKKQHENLKLRNLEQEQRIQQLSSLLNEKQLLMDNLYSEKRNLEADLETVWQTTMTDVYV